MILLLVGLTLPGMRVLNYGNPVNRAAPNNRGLLHWFLCPPARGRGNTFFDIAGRSHGALTNGAAFSGSVPPNHFGSVSLDGTNDYVGCGNISSTLFSGDFTVCIAFYAAAIGTKTLVAKGAAAGDGLMIFTRVTSNRLELRIDSSTLVGTDGQVTPNVWHHAVITRVANMGAIYLDGFTHLAPSGISEDGSNTAEFRLGENDPSSAIPWSGLLTDCRVFGRGMTASEAFAQTLAHRQFYPQELNRLQRPACVEQGGGGATAFPWHYYQQMMAG